MTGKFTNEKQEENDGLFTREDGQLIFKGFENCLNTEGPRDSKRAEHEEKIAREFERLFRVFSIGGSLVFVGTHRSFEGTIPNGTNFQLRRTR